MRRLLFDFPKRRLPVTSDQKKYINVSAEVYHQVIKDGSVQTQVQFTLLSPTLPLHVHVLNR